MAIGGIGRGRRQRHLNAEVNIINLVDVVLVLLIIFMVTAPMLQGGIQVNLPRTIARPLDASAGMTITVLQDGTVAVGETAMSYEEFRQNIGSIVSMRQPEGVYIRGDARASHGDVSRVLAAVRETGIERVGLVTEPERLP